MTFSAVVVAAGSGLRAGAGTPKAWRMLGGRPLLRWSVESLLAAGCTELAVVVAPDRMDRIAEALKGLAHWHAVLVFLPGSSPHGRYRRKAIDLSAKPRRTGRTLPYFISVLLRF